MDTAAEEFDSTDISPEEELGSNDAPHNDEWRSLIRATTAKMINEAAAAMSASGAPPVPFSEMIIGVVLGLSMWAGIIVLASPSF